MDEDQIVAPISLETARRFIVKHLRPANRLDYLGGGSYSAFAVDQQLVVRFPKMPAEDADAIFQKEQALTGSLDVQPHKIPKPLKRLLPDDEIFPKPVYVYSFLDGKQGTEFPADLQLATQAGDFLSKLHSLTTLPGLSQRTPMDVKQHWDEQHDYLQSQINPLLQPDEQRWLAEVFASVEDVEPPALVVTHGDFNAENVLVPDPFNHLQVVDFEDIGLHDAAADFCLWWGDYGNKFLEVMLKAYTLPIDADFHTRMRFYYNRVPVIYFRYGIENDIPNMIRFGHDALRQRMHRNP